MIDVTTRLRAHLLKRPKLGGQVYIAQGAIVVGDVEIGERSSIWYNAVLRGDINRIVVGIHTNIQDNAVVHLAEDLPCLIGNYVTIGHSAIVHACTVGNQTLIGMGATILDGAVIGNHCLIGANSLVTQGARIPDGSLAFGSPAKVLRQLAAREIEDLKLSAEHYVENAAFCLARRIGIGVIVAS
ncbi:MAG: gamma carbonic anhydrase family protein [Verrucomicrobia bacterium]|nr:gamma carbonic anhydrase family protein [Verrucomicrobiota bacterium]